MNDIIQIAKSSSWVTLIPILIFISNFIVLLKTNRAERLRLTSKQRLKINIATIVVMSLTSSVILSIIAVVSPEFSTKHFVAILIITFIIYLVLFTCLYPLVEHINKIHFYILDSNNSRLYIQHITLDNKVLLSSTPSIGSKFKKGAVFFKSLDILDEKEILFISRKQLKEDQL
ncbi:hypothetical protein PaeCFBP13512_02435 [Paenibacillus sp. CFBP13512]|uniref:hypothetical protein n=1 Tax=Paenibacillus sp. CFBP13512 TaxID=2184007 RepID=UPI0010C03A9D|nr:hypothetical protein [Paenibacillus sp. CFBP13512]TKJ94376.1 hypothetical protein PaeCFBP13512_02435 [Paenibacillus sp. CFBP13512]